MSYSRCIKILKVSDKGNEPTHILENEATILEYECALKKREILVTQK